MGQGRQHRRAQMAQQLPNEAHRLAALRRLGIVDTCAENHFDAVCRLTRDLFAVPIALISFVEEDRQWFKAKCGLSLDGTRRETAFCSYAILSDEVFIVEDATADERFAENPLVRGEPYIRFYAGAPLILEPGVRVGTLCIKDTLARVFTRAQVRQLQDLAEIVVAHLRLHQANLRQAEEIAAREASEAVMRNQARALHEREIALRDSNRLLVMDEEIAEIGHFRFRPAMGQRVWSEQVYRIFGLDPSRPPPGLADAVNGYHPDDQKAVRQILASAIAQEANCCFEARVLRPSGEIRDVVVRGTFVRSEADQTSTLMGVIIDVSERAERERALRASEARYRTLADALPQIVWTMRASDGEATYVNRQFEAFYGPIGTSALARLSRNHPEDTPRLKRAWQAVRDGRTIEIEARLRRHDGIYRWHKLVMIPIRRDGRVAEWFGTALDIDDIVTARTKLEETTDLLRLAQDAAGAGVWEWDIQASLVRLSAQNAHMHGVAGPLDADADARVAVPAHELKACLHPEDVALVRVEAERAIRQRDTFSAEYRVVRSHPETGRQRWLQSFGRVVCEAEQGEPVRLVGLVLDVSERKEAEAALRISQDRLAASEERLAHALDSGSDGLWDWDLVTNAAWFSERWHRMLGYEAGELEPHLRTWERIIHPDDAERAVGEMRDHLKGLTPLYHCEYRLRGKDGAIVWVLTRGRVVSRDAEGRALRIVGTQSDITPRKQAEEAQRLSEERLALALDSGSDGLWDWSIETGEISFFGQWFRTLGYEPGEVESHIRNWMSLVHPEDVDNALRHMTDHFKGRTPLYECEYRLQKKWGGYLWTLARGRVVSRSESGRALRMVGTYIDITRRKEAEHQVAHMAVHDALTGLPNRKLFWDRLDQEIRDAERQGSSFAVLACDLDRFKTINDTRGHPAGDALLCTVADRLSAVVRDGDIVARLGGDEFAIILRRLDHPETAKVIAGRAIEALGQPVDLDGYHVTVGVSVGVAIGLQDGSDADTLFKNADIALYQAKAAGRNTCRFYEAGMDVRIADRNILEYDLRAAIKRGGFTLNYQPVVSLATGQVGGFEALLRWQHPTRGPISPAEFIPLAEETGLIVALGDWALREACLDAASWPGERLIAVNVSAVQFQNQGLEQSVVMALATSGLPARRLELEITESVLMQDSEAVIATLHRLRALGIRIALDDFGTGYSSLSYLRRFPFDKIKIDRSFIREIDNPDTAAIVRAVVALGAHLGTAITAEGVETQAQLERVREEGCTDVQGFLLSRPLSAEDAQRFLCGSAEEQAA